MTSKIINYGARTLIIIVGILLVTGYLDPPGYADTTFIRVLGAVAILFGIYRIVIYYSQIKRQERYEEMEKKKSRINRSG